MKRDLVVKVFKEGYFLRDLQRLWPPGLAKAALPYRYSLGIKSHEEYQDSAKLCWALDVQLLKGDRFAFVFDRHWGDLRKFLDMRMLENNHVPPFSFKTTVLILLRIAEGMKLLHKLGLLHRDLKAANVLIMGYGQTTNGNPAYREDVILADFESSVGIVGTGFWRAPEVLLALKYGSLKPETFTAKSDVYAYAMTCYEVITGCVPFDGCPPNDYDVVLCGGRPTLPDDICLKLKDLVTACWHKDPLQRPSFEWILKSLQFLSQNVRDENLKVRGLFLSDTIRLSSTPQWTELISVKQEDESGKSEKGFNKQVQSHLEVYDTLVKEHPEWGLFLGSGQNMEFRIGEKIGEGGQAEVFEAIGSAWEGTMKPLVVKVFKEDCCLQSLLQVKPPVSNRLSKVESFARICWPLGVKLVMGGRFAFVYDRYWGDSRKLIDNVISNDCRFVLSLRFIYRIAKGMRKLHRLGILHRDLKSSSVLVDIKEEHETNDTVRKLVYSRFIAIADFEVSAGTMGTGLWRAPEIPLAIKNGCLIPTTFTREADVYSFAIICYEVITGNVPFECDQPSASDYDAVICGQRPTLPDGLPLPVAILISECWHEDPAQRPSFEVIVRTLDRLLPGRNFRLGWPIW